MNRFLRVGCSVHRPEAGLRLVLRLLVPLIVFQCHTYCHGARLSNVGKPILQAALGSSSVKSTSPKASNSSAHPWVELVSWRPRAFLYHNFLSAEECRHIMQEAKPMMRRSTVIGASGDSVQDSIRTSHGAFLPRRHDSTVASIEDRLAAWTHLPMTHQEDLQVLRYTDGEKYGPHFDSAEHPGDDNKGRTARVATVLMYLNNDSALLGGETAFPQAPAATSTQALSPCAAGVVAVQPRRGDALLFYNLKPDRTQDYFSLHTSCPVLNGVKWTATKWIHVEPFHPEWLELGVDQSKAIKPEDCRDVEPSCTDWAASGECTRNKEYMVGNDVTLGQCRASCKECEICAASDQACRMRNRAKAGFLVLQDEQS